MENRVEPEVNQIRETSPSKQDPLLVLYQPILLSSLGFAFLGFALPIYGKELGASALEIGGLFSVVTAVIALLRPVVGWALDKFGRKIFFVAALTCFAGSMALFAVVNNIAGLYLAQLVRGLGAAMMWVSTYTIATDLAATQKRGEAIGYVTQARARGNLFGGIIGFVLISKLPTDIGWQVVFAGYALLAALGAWLGWQNVPETRPLQASRTGPTRAISRQLLRLMAIVFVTALSTSMLGPIFLIFLQDRFTVDIGTLVLAIVPAGIVASYLPSRLGKLSDRFGRRSLMALGLVGSGIVSFFLPLLPGVIWLAILWTLESVGWAMAGPAEGAMIADLTGHRVRGRGYGLYTFVASIGATIGPLLGGWAYDAVGQAVPFYLNGVVLLVGAGLILLLLSRDRAYDQPEQVRVSEEPA